MAVIVLHGRAMNAHIHMMIVWSVMMIGNLEIDEVDFNNMTRNPIHQSGGKWYFWDETWCHRAGPFDTEIETYDALERYCSYLEYSTLREKRRKERELAWSQLQDEIRKKITPLLDKVTGVSEWIAKKLTFWNR